MKFISAIGLIGSVSATCDFDLKASWSHGGDWGGFYNKVDPSGTMRTLGNSGSS